MEKKKRRAQLGAPPPLGQGGQAEPRAHSHPHALASSLSPAHTGGDRNRSACCNSLQFFFAVLLLDGRVSATVSSPWLQRRSYFNNLCFSTDRCFSSSGQSAPCACGLRNQAPRKTTEPLKNRSQLTALQLPLTTVTCL